MIAPIVVTGSSFLSRKTTIYLARRQVNALTPSKMRTTALGQKQPLSK
jgi:hypothetical protein